MIIGVSLKLYLDRPQTRVWCAAAARLASQHPAVQSGAVKFVVFPSLPAMELAMTMGGDAPLDFGAQDLFWADRGAYTGTVSGADLADMGCRYAEIGHAERRRLFGEDNHIVAKKVAAAVRNQLIPWLCVGEPHPCPPNEAAEFCAVQFNGALSELMEPPADFIVAYEPVWAIGQSNAADAAHVSEVTREIKYQLAARFGNQTRTAVIYGGSAGTGTLTELGNAVDGLFLGRFAHDINALEHILDEARALHQQRNR